ncbi:hypothetical protein Tco_0053572 [Tanacetum coccineum]
MPVRISFCLAGHGHAVQRSDLIKMIMEALEAGKLRSRQLSTDSYPPPFRVRQRVLFRCSRSGSLMFNAFFFEISMECLVQEFRASICTDSNKLEIRTTAPRLRYSP